MMAIMDRGVNITNPEVVLNPVVSVNSLKSIYERLRNVVDGEVAVNKAMKTRELLWQTAE